MNLSSFQPNTSTIKFLFALALVILALLIRLWILPVDGRVIYSTFYPALGVTALVCGYRYGLLSLFVSAVLAYWFLLLPPTTWKPLNSEQLIGAMTFISAGLVICLSFTRPSDKAESIF